MRERSEQCGNGAPDAHESRRCRVPRSADLQWDVDGLPEQFRASPTLRFDSAPRVAGTKRVSGGTNYPQTPVCQRFDRALRPMHAPQRNLFRGRLNDCAASSSTVFVNTLRSLALGALLLVLGLASPLAAQGVDIIRGRVTAPDGTGIPNVTVTATTLLGQVNRRVTTDGSGRYTISFPGGEGDYWVSFTSIGLTPRRYQVKRTADQEILIADARMSPQPFTLDAVTTSARAGVSRGDTVGDVSGNERDLQTAIDPGLLSVEQMGDLAAMASAIPGVQLIPGADGGADQFSVFGLGGDQNNTQLNGLNFGDGSVPRDASILSSVSTSPYDVARGGFSGGQITLRTRSGSNFMTRSLSSNLVAPQMQWADRAAAATGQQYTNMSLGGGASGPIQPDRLFYNSSFQFDRNLNDLQTLLNTSALGFNTAGVAPDSVLRLLDILGAQSLPANIAGFPGQRSTDRLNLLGSIDFTPLNSSRGNTYALTFSGNVNRSLPTGGGFGGAGLSTPTRNGKSLNYSLSSQLRQSGLLGWHGILTETSIGASTRQSDAEPYTLLPAASVRVNSQFEDGSASVRNLQFGGSPNSNTQSGNNTVGFVNTLSWFSEDNRHRLKLTSEARYENYWQDLTSNELGTFSFNSLADLEAGKPASFTRQLAPRRREGSVAIGAMSLGDAWRPRDNLQVQYGVRVDGNRFLMGPETNPAVVSAFGVDNATVPNRLYVSPRVGFSWTYGSAAEVAFIPGQARIPRAVVRGGIGIFQNAPNTQLIAGAIDNTGLPGALQQLTCLGAAAPSPNWSEYQIDIANIPLQCADGTSGTVFANSSPNVSLFASDYMTQRSLRSNLQWSGAILKNRFNASIDATYSLNYGQSGTIDLNFPAEAQFSLANEGGRPVFVSPSVIVPSTGQTAWRNARVVDAFGRVSQQRSDISSDSKQLTVRLSPIAFNSKLRWSTSYVLSDVREQFYGFSSTVGDPMTREWGAGRFSRHQIQASLSREFFERVTLSWGFNLRSGTPYTPRIAGDVNGDSYGNDRAFIFDPSSVRAQDPVLASSLESLLATTSGGAQACLQAQLGTLAGRNSCRGPWTIDGNLTVRFNSIMIGLPQRANLSLQIANPIGGIDRLINGQDNLKGWGQNPNIDDQLLYVRGFDAATQTYRYEANERFGNTNPALNTQRRPTALTAIVGFDVGPTREKQQLMQQLDRGRTRPGNKPTAQQLRGTVSAGLVNPMAQILQQSDSLKLTRQQADSLVLLNRRYVLKSDSIWLPLAREFSELPDRFNHDAAFAKYRRGREASVDMLLRLTPEIKDLLTPDQYRMLPAQIASAMDARTLRAIRSGTAGGRGGFGGGGFGGGFGGGGGGRGR